MQILNCSPMSNHTMEPFGPPSYIINVGRWAVSPFSPSSAEFMQQAFTTLKSAQLSCWLVSQFNTFKCLTGFIQFHISLISQVIIIHQGSNQFNQERKWCCCLPTVSTLSVFVQKVYCGVFFNICIARIFCVLMFPRWRLFKFRFSAQKNPG